MTISSAVYFAAPGTAEVPVPDAGAGSWKTMFEAAGLTVNCQISGLGRIDAIHALYVAHTKAAIDAIA